MTIAKETLTRAAEQLTPSEAAIINEKLDVAITSKENTNVLRFSPPEEGEDPNSSINLGLFGLQDSDSLRKFLLTPAGETVTHEIGAELALEKAIEEEHQLQIHEQIMMQERRRALLFHWLLDEEAESKKAQDELIEMQQEKILKDEQNAQKKSAPPEPNKATKDAIEGYGKAIEKLQDDQKALEQRSEKLKSERKMLNEKYDTYDQGLKEFNAPQFEVQTEAQLKAQIEALQREADAISDKMMQPGIKDEEIYKLGNQLNTVGLKIASLDDILAKQKNEKVFANANGETQDSAGNAISYKDAAFVLSKGQKIEKDTDGNYYLLKAGQELKDMGPEAKSQAKKDFEVAKKDIKVVRDVVTDTKQEELHLNSTRSAQVKAEKIMVQNQINLMQSSKAQLELTQKPTPGALPMTSPQSTKTLSGINVPTLTQSSKVTSTPMPSPQQIFSAAAFVQTVNNGQQPVTWGAVFNKVQTIQDPEAKKEADKFFTDEAKKTLSKEDTNKLDKEKSPLAIIDKIKNMVKMTPIPQTTMEDFLKNMPKFGQDSYKPNVTSEESPVAQREQTQPSAPSSPR